jgi:hypothetical protein
MNLDHLPVCSGRDLARSSHLGHVLSEAHRAGHRVVVLITASTDVSSALVAEKVNRPHNA